MTWSAPTAVPRFPPQQLAGHRAVDVEAAVPGWQQRADLRVRAVTEHEPCTGRVT
ncbi:hypothetical protein [Streptomyces yaizuensis]|uniref:Uncharacterized protein n=1 Tax=Streptomyces yaizuensis TaxID=2989713 RepID=A0ABQ5P6E2_9ACTN|nr:hypothetical protein [Streptomyces sp. YSPA8]GLF98162.1 hypothetical protein SYYSPA8_27715 [Streptomyces sp. YSPA8]